MAFFEFDDEPWIWPNVPEATVQRRASACAEDMQFFSEHVRPDRDGGAGDDRRQPVRAAPLHGGRFAAGKERPSPSSFRLPGGGSQSEHERYLTEQHSTDRSLCTTIPAPSNRSTCE